MKNFLEDYLEEFNVNTNIAEQEVCKRLNDNIPKETTFPPTFIVLEFSPNIKEETAQWIIDKIRPEKRREGIGLLVAAQPDDGDHNWTIHISVGLNELFQLAEKQNVLKIDLEGILREFSIEEILKFTNSENQEKFFTPSERQIIVFHELENIRASAKETHIPGYPKVSLYEGQAIIERCRSHGIVKQIYPLHDNEELKKIDSTKFFEPISIFQLEKTRMYFGESIGLYFEFLKFYIYFLFISAIIDGFRMVFSTKGYLIFSSILNIISATLFLMLWRRKCAELAFTWGTITMTSLDEPRPNFRGQMGRDCVSDRLLPQYPRWKTNLKMYCVSLPLVMVCMFGAFLVMLASFKVEEMLQKIDHFSLIIYMPSMIYAALIYVMNLIYRRFANFLTEWENHRTQSQFDRHRVIKVAPFEFVNNFISLFYIAFVMQDMKRLNFRLIMFIIFVFLINELLGEIISSHSRKVYIKMKELFGKETSEYLKSKRPKLRGLTIISSDDPRIKQAVSEGMMKKYDDPYDIYLGLFVQFGYVFLFTPSNYLGALFAFCVNIVVMRIVTFKLCCYYQRPMPRKVKDMGAWQMAFHGLCIVAVITNFGLLCIHIKTNETETFWIITFLILEHIILCLILILYFSIPDKPERVKIALARGNYLSKQALKRQGKSNRATFN